MIAYQRIAKFVALRALQTAEGDAAAIELAYQAASIESELEGTELPYSALKDTILAVEAEIAEMIGNSNNALYRAALEIQSASVASGATIPLKNASNVPFTGAFDGVFETTSNKPLREMPLQYVLRRIANTGSFHKIPVLYFAREGTKIYHTTANAYFRGCGWDYATQAAQFDLAATQPANLTYGTADVNTGTDIITKTNHGYWTGLKHRHVNGGSGLPTGLAVDTDYFFIVLDANTFKIASSYDNALKAVAINLTGAGGNGNTLSIIGSSGGGQSPLPAALELLFGCKVLEHLAQENWFVSEAAFYQNLVRGKEMMIVEGKMNLLSLPDMPIKQSNVNPIGG